MYGGGASAFSSQASAPAAKGKAPPPKAAPPAKAGGKPVVDPSDELSAAAEQEKRKQEQILAEKARIEVENQLRRQHPHMLLWLMTKVEIISILLQQNRIEDVTDAISVTKLECMAIKDQLFIRKLEEIDFMVLVKGGKIAEAVQKSNEICAHAKKYNQTDLSYAEFLGNLSEMLYTMNKRDEACEIVKEGRKIAWYRLRDQGIEIDQ